ncbi:hypothetical protein OG607_26795 [Streptomyces sp. NBC_01537]|uniref:hypothetical protein n=1 Tax=Streptomyces sp. NBC_01537 TaxID=2903896 RepID=UPI00386FB617
MSKIPGQDPSVAEAVGGLLTDVAVPNAVIDLDWLSQSWPAPPSDRFNFGMTGLAPVVRWPAVAPHEPDDAPASERSAHDREQRSRHRQGGLRDRSRLRHRPRHTDAGQQVLALTHDVSFVVGVALPVDGGYVAR